MSRRALLVVGSTAAALLAAAAVGTVLLLARSPGPAEVEEAVARYREASANAPSGASPVPEGVYVYETEGFERTDALTGVRNRYPDRSTITVLRHECGVTMRWDVLDGRSTTWLFRTTPAGWALESQDERHTFFGRTERTTYVCERGLLRPAGDVVGASSEVACVAGGATERGETRVVAREIVRVQGGEVEAVHVRRTSSFEGEIRGGSRHELWIDRGTGVPVRIELASETANDSPLGEVRYEEDVTLLLTALTPRR